MRVATVSTNVDPDTAPAGRTAIIKFVVLTYALSWSVWAGGWLLAGRPDRIGDARVLAAVYAGTFAPGLVAGLLSALEGRGSFRAWLGGFVRLRCGWRAYAAALLPLPIAFAVLTWALGYTPRVEAGGQPAAAFYLTLFPISILNGAATALVGAGPLGEEGGWRGFLLPRLLDRMGELRAAALIGVIWALWHLPVMMFFVDWREGTSLAFYLPTYVVGVVALSYVFAAVWRLGGGGLVPCIWLHGLVNAIGGLAFNHRAWDGGWSQEASVWHSILAFWVVALGFWAVRRSTHPRRGEAAAD